MKIKLFHIIIFLFCSKILLLAQDTSLEVAQDTIKPSEERYDRIYKLFLEDQGRETKRLWKLNLVDMAHLGPNLCLEQKTGNRFSSETYLGIKRFDYQQGFNLEAEISQQLKFYYNLKGREEKGKRINGFSANYFSVYLYASHVTEPAGPPYYTSSEIRPYNRNNNFKYGVGLNYGIQRRIGNIGYFDLFAGVRYSYVLFHNFPSADYFNMHQITSYSGNLWEFEPVIGLKAGFAIDSFKNLKYMLK